ncbi:hypothetical protein [Bradyrhizobium cytisi]|uniref:Uncharacterized protein n=1 Tax=Bradyrhizobium cytisi TaxID=515489 RepID=A0A5S4WYS3_9BRAD|nr:hypothetical protein [Bradyrhizobium cytisi]TYL86776.1 hypothetical protein FXB38_05820 [Bradyrhizobium cytisi]
MNKSEALTDREQKLLIALVKMVDQYLDEYGDQVDSRAMSAGEHAIKALASVGLMENVNTRFGRWTEAGNQFREKFNSLRGLASAEESGGIKLVGRPKPEG